MDAALRESQERYNALAEATHDSIFIVDANATIQYVNSTCRERFALRDREAIGQKIFDVFAPAVARRIWTEASSVMTTGQSGSFEDRFDGPAGDLWLGVWLVPVSGDTAVTPSVMVVARDIGDRKLLEREFAQAQKMEAVGRLAGGVAHDFNNLLTAIVGYSELLLESVGPDSQFAADLHEIRNAGERASRLTRQLLTFSRKQTVSPTTINLNDVIGDLQKMLTRVIGEDIALDVTMEPQLAPALADAGQVEQVVMNLVVNARDAMPDGGTIRIATANAELTPEFCRVHEGARPARYVALVIQDTGSGIPADALPHVFKPFFTTKPAGEGTGLGLSTVCGIVKESGGYIMLDSTLGIGTTITIYFPAASESHVSSDRPHCWLKAQLMTYPHPPS